MAAPGRAAAQCVLHAAALLLFLAAMLPSGANGMAPLRPWSLASARTEFGFTTDCMRTLRKLEKEKESEDNLLSEPMEDVVNKIPFVSDLIDLYQKYFGTEKGENVPDYVLEGPSDLSAFPKNGCVSKNGGMLAMCRKQLNVKKNGFEWKADVAFLVKYHATTWVDPRDQGKPEPPFEQVKPNCTETLFVDSVKQWKGIVSARRPGMNFCLQRIFPEKKEGALALTPAQIEKLPMQFIPIRPGPEDARKLPMELAVRFDDVRCSGETMSAKMRLECKAKGVSVHNATMGSFRIYTD